MQFLFVGRSLIIHALAEFRPARIAISFPEWLEMFKHIRTNYLQQCKHLLWTSKSWSACEKDDPSKLLKKWKNSFSSFCWGVFEIVCLICNCDVGLKSNKFVKNSRDCVIRADEHLRAIKNIISLFLEDLNLFLFKCIIPFEYLFFPIIFLIKQS